MPGHAKTTSRSRKLRGVVVFVLFVVVTCLLTACSDHGGGGAPPGSGFVTTEPQDDARYVFDDAALRSYDIQLAPQDLAAIDADPKAEQYVAGSVTIDGEQVQDVGVRYKGSVGAFFPPCTGSGFGSGGPKTGKCSIKLAFDHVDPDARYRGLRKLNLHAVNRDESMMRDRLGYTMFRGFGVPAPRAVHARVSINGEPEGLFVVVEQVDGRFTRSRFGDGGEGNLYKEIWPFHDDADAYTAALETNEDQMPSVQGMLDFHAAIGGGLAQMESFVDRDAVLRYIAADRVMINDDGIFHWWCAAGGQGNNPGGTGNHNYYWYEGTPGSSTPRFSLIPWDMDSSLGGSPVVHIDVPWTDMGSCECGGGGGFAGQRTASCDPLIALWTQWAPEYERYVDQFLTTPFAASQVDALLAKWEAQITPSVEEFAGRNGAPAAAQWRQALTALRDELTSMREHRGYAY